MIITLISIFALLTYVAGFVIIVPVAGRFWIRHSSYSHTRTYGLDDGEAKVLYVIAAFWPITMWLYVVESIGRGILYLFGRVGVKHEKITQYINRSAGIGS